jgi:hypothetical protein
MISTQEQYELLKVESSQLGTAIADEEENCGYVMEDARAHLQTLIDRLRKYEEEHPEIIQQKLQSQSGQTEVGRDCIGSQRPMRVAS